MNNKYFSIVFLFFIFCKGVLKLFGIDFVFSLKKRGEKSTPVDQKKDTLAKKEESKTSIHPSAKKKKNRKGNKPLYIKKYKKNKTKKIEKIKRLNSILDAQRKATGKVNPKTVSKLKSEKAEMKEKPKVAFAKNQDHNKRAHSSPSYKRRSASRKFLQMYFKSYFDSPGKWDARKNKKVITLKNLVDGFDIGRAIDFDMSVYDILADIFKNDHMLHKAKPYLFNYNATPLMLELSKLSVGKQYVYLNRLYNFVAFGTVENLIKTGKRLGELK